MRTTLLPPTPLESLEGGSNNLVVPWLRSTGPGTELTPERLYAAVDEARKPRGARRGARFPRARLGYAKAKVLDSGEFRPRKTHEGDLYRYLLVLGLRAMNDLHAVGSHLPDAEALGEALLTVIYERGQVWHEHDRQSGGGVGIRSDKAERVAEGAAARVIEFWHPRFIHDKRRKGAAGGRRSRRGPTWTVEHLKAVEGLSVAKAAAALGCSESTIKRLKRELRDAAT